MRAVVVGAGAVGVRAARQLVFLGALDSIAIVEPRQGRQEAVVASLGEPAFAAPELEAVVGAADVVVLAGPAGHRELAETALDHGVSVISVSDDVDDVRDLLALDAEARERNVSVV